MINTPGAVDYTATALVLKKLLLTQMLNRLLLLFLFFTATMTLTAKVYIDRGHPAPRLIVNNSPMLVLGGELGNSSATCAEDIASIFPKLSRMGLNTVLVPAYWDLIEPVEGEYDFTLTDNVISEAQLNNLKVIFLWFGAWKNSMSCYTPLWFKKDYKKYPRAYTRAGEPLEIASAFSPEVFAADSTAFSRWLDHVDSVDNDDTVIAIQIENEIGMLEDARDHSELADKIYKKGVPASLCEYINKNRDKLHPHILSSLKVKRLVPGMSWNDAFGDETDADEIFMAWNYATYVERLARHAKTKSSRPLYVNAAMDSRGRRAGQYPSAGPLAKLTDVWMAAAPSLDFLSPDIYDSGITNWIAGYDRPGNIVFVPEIKMSRGNAAQAFYAIGEHDAIGLSPFSIENGDDSAESPNVKGYELMTQMIPFIVTKQGTGDMNGLYFDADSVTRILDRDGMRITSSHYFTLPWDPRSKDGSRWPEVGGVIIKIAPMEYIIAGSGLVIKFEDSGSDTDVSVRGEDGFAAQGADTSSQKRWKSRRKIGIGSVAEVRFKHDGSFEPVRYFNGDETHQGRHVRIGVDDFKALHVKLYEYK